MPRKSPDRASRSQIIQINDLMREALIKHPDGLVEYKEHHTDTTIAEVVKASVSSVAKLRNELYGRLRKVGTDPAETKQKHHQLEQKIELLENQLHEVRVKFHKAILALSLQGYKELRHLTLVDMGINGEPTKKQEKV